MKLSELMMDRATSEAYVVILPNTLDEWAEKVALLEGVVTAARGFMRERDIGHEADIHDALAKLDEE